MKATSDMKTYAIRWKSTVSGRIGTGTMRFEKEDADLLVTELNEKYPDIDHEAVIPPPPSAEPAVVEPVQALSA
jgi:hypothetical protein